jgi:RNA polymerase sigma factor (sigma-70 family)
MRSPNHAPECSVASPPWRYRRNSWDRFPGEANAHEPCAPPAPTDGQLLARFAAERDEEAFATLVKRHGARVLAVGRRILRHRQDAEDVFQATFLILARKAGEVRWQPSVGNWLHEVACRLAREARSRRAEQRARQEHAAERAARREGRRADLAELAALLDEEMLGLPPRLRQVVMLCYYAGQTREETARQLGCSLRTVERRLQQARQRLRERLARHDVTFSGAVLALRLGPSAGDVFPRELAGRAVRAAVASAGREGAPVALSSEVADLVTSGMKTIGEGMGG